MGKDFKEYLEKRLATLEGAGSKSFNQGISKQKTEKFAKKPKTGGYNADADVAGED